MNTESNISEHLDKAKDISKQLDEMLLAVENVEKYIHELAEQIINLLSIIDNPAGRFKRDLDDQRKMLEQKRKDLDDQRKVLEQKRKDLDDEIEEFNNRRKSQ